MNNIDKITATQGVNVALLCKTLPEWQVRLDATAKAEAAESRYFELAIKWSAYLDEKAKCVVNRYWGDVVRKVREDGTSELLAKSHAAGLAYEEALLEEKRADEAYEEASRVLKEAIAKPSAQAA